MDQQLEETTGEEQFLIWSPPEYGCLGRAAVSEKTTGVGMLSWTNL